MGEMDLARSVLLNQLNTSSPRCDDSSVLRAEAADLLYGLPSFCALV